LKPHRQEEDGVSRFVHLKIHKEAFTFSAGHFTIFSATERETLHGHNYYVSLALTVEVTPQGLSFDYRHYKKKMRTLCAQLDKHVLLPSQSPYLHLEEEKEYWYAHFNQKKIPFLKEDVVLLPVTNISIEELSHWFLQKIRDNPIEIHHHAIHGITVKVYNGLKQSSSAGWSEKTTSFSVHQKTAEIDLTR
jgi:6-pyruvoyltetrahydropterin/6-carboxytetrahydropterin synthase